MSTVKKCMIGYLAVAVLLLLFSALLSGREQHSDEISLSVSPRVALVNPYKRAGFRVLIRIPERSEVRRYLYQATCGSEAKEQNRVVDAEVFDKIEELTVIENCVFTACVLGKKRVCVTETVEAR